MIDHILILYVQEMFLLNLLLQYYKLISFLEAKISFMNGLIVVQCHGNTFSYSSKASQKKENYMQYNKYGFCFDVWQLWACLPSEA